MSNYYEEENKCILPDIHCLKFDRCEICKMSYSKGKTDAIEEFTRYLANNSELGNVAYLYKASYVSEQLKEQK